MKIALYLTCFAVTLSLLGCGLGLKMSKDNIGVTGFETEKSLPEGQWSGEGFTRYADGQETTFKSTVTIKSNVISSSNSSGGFSSQSSDRFLYLSPRNVLWLDPAGSTIGKCECVKQACLCKSQTNQLNISRVLSFSKVGLEISDEGKQGSREYRQFSRLSRK